MNLENRREFGQEFGTSVIDAYCKLVQSICGRIGHHYNITPNEVLDILSPEGENEYLQIVESFYVEGKPLPFTNSFIEYEILKLVRNFMSRIKKGKYRHFPTGKFIEYGKDDVAYSPYGFCVYRHQKTLYWPWLVKCIPK